MRITALPSLRRLQHKRSFLVLQCVAKGLKKAAVMLPCNCYYLQPINTSLHLREPLARSPYRSRKCALRSLRRLSVM